MRCSWKEKPKVSSTAEFDRQAQQNQSRVQSILVNNVHNKSSQNLVGVSSQTSRKVSAPPVAINNSTLPLTAVPTSANSTTFVPCPASLPRLMFPRCSNESDVGPVEIARRESQHFLHNTDIIVSQRDETRQLSKELIAQAKDAADKLEKTQTSLKTFYNTLGKMADNFGRTYTGNREIGQELIRLTARHKEACDILADVTTAFRRFSGSASSRAGSPDTHPNQASVIDRVSKQFQKECESARKENDELKKSMEDMGYKYGSSIQTGRRGSVGKIKRMDTTETNKYLTKAARSKELFISSLMQQRKFMCVFCASVCGIVDHELRMAEKLSGCEAIYCNLVKNITHIDKLPEHALNDIKVAGQVSSTDVVFKSSASVTGSAPQGGNGGTVGGEPQYDSISQTSSLGSSSTSLSTNGSSTDSPSGTTSSLADSGFPSSRESSHDDPDYRDPALYFPNGARPSGANMGTVRGNSNIPPGVPNMQQMSCQMTSSQSKLFSVPAPPPRRGSVCQPPYPPSGSGGGTMSRGSAEKIATGNYEQSVNANGNGENQVNNLNQQQQQQQQMFDMNSVVRPYSVTNATPTNTLSSTSSYSIHQSTSQYQYQLHQQQRLSQPVLPSSCSPSSPSSSTSQINSINNSRNLSSAPNTPVQMMEPSGHGFQSTPGNEQSSSCNEDIWVPREDFRSVLRNESPTQSCISKSQSSSTDTLEAADSPSQTRKSHMSRDRMGVSDSLSSSTDTLDDSASSPNKASSNSASVFGPTILHNYTRSPGRSVPHSSTTQNLTSDATESNDHSTSSTNQIPSYERVQSDDSAENRTLTSNIDSESQKEFLSDVSLKSCSSSDSEQAYTTIKRSPKQSDTSSTVIDKPADCLTISSEEKLSEKERDFNESFTDEEASDFMKQLRQRRRTLNAVDKNSLPFWEKYQENSNESNESSSLS
ncbi:uncharacterized protein LOC142354308 isoform X3 [Convolutriloba macropyga]|uniref:uncharacterized protein LOC142354308 isoform X3 n=1 Tax=Convolutriloba macropyga TaxID=536237 RepID=UPI003F51AD42